MEGWSIEDDFIVITKYGSEKSRVNIASRIRNLVTWISKLFEGSNTPSEKLIEYEAVQVVSGYHEILRSVIFPVKGNDLILIRYSYNCSYIHMYLAYTWQK